MKIDFLKVQVDRYREDKDQYQEEESEFSEDENRVEDIRSTIGTLEEEIQGNFESVLSIYREEREGFEELAESLSQEQVELASDVSLEKETTEQAVDTLGSVNDNKYGHAYQEAIQLGEQNIIEAQRLLDILEEYGEKSNPEGASSSDSTEYSQTLLTDFYFETDYQQDQGLISKVSQRSVENILKSYPKIIGNHSIEQDIEIVNPNYYTSSDTRSWRYNCQRCVMAYEARRRGYNVVAKPRGTDGERLPIMMDPKGWPSVYKNFQLIDCSANLGTGAKIRVDDTVKNWGDNARGIVRVRWKPECGGGGHVFIVERVNGVTRYMDPQNGKLDVSKYFFNAAGQGVTCMRTDDLKFTNLIDKCCDVNQNQKRRFLC
ncbi:MAG: toxin glutamine deamidase domain-containing protein [Anaerostipes sp.]|jgi:hypothetical protein